MATLKQDAWIRPLPGPRVLMTTEGTYPYSPGGVTTWCKFLVAGLSDFRWQVLPITTGSQRALPACPKWVSVLPPIEIWGGPPKGWRPPSGGPASDVLLVTAAGWSAIPALVHRAMHGTPLLLIEHGVFVRESYLAATKKDAPTRFATTRLARGLARVAYSGADIVNPVQEANSA